MRAPRLATLEALGDVAPRDAHERHMRIVILKDILAHDAEIRELTAPWLTQLETMLRNMSRRAPRAPGVPLASAAGPVYHERLRPP